MKWPLHVAFDYSNNYTNKKERLHVALGKQIEVATTIIKSIVLWMYGGWQFSHNDRLSAEVILGEGSPYL